MADLLLVELGKTIGKEVGSEVWKTIVGATDIDSQIKGLQDIKTTLEATLLDADSSQVCSHSQRDVLEKLQRGLAKLIDFQEAKAAKAMQKQLMGGTKFAKELRLFFSGSNQLVSPFKDARKIKGITGELSRIARNHAQFGSVVSSSTFNQTRTLSNVSGSYMSTDLVVGRDVDREKMVDLLLDSSGAAGIIPVASIVGMGGVGKTTLAQYVYNDDRIKKYFDVQFWVFATDDFNVKDVLRQMVTCATDENTLDYVMDQLQRRLFQAIVGKRFMLVLDGVWDEDNLRAKWLELRAMLRVGAQGSQVLLTTRNDTVARIIGTSDSLKVNDLGDDDSWLLFRHIAVTEWHEPEVEVIGKKIVEMCPNVPLVIRAIGSLLCGKYTVREWRAFRNDQLKNFASYGRDVISTLKLSYYHLGPNLKLCVAYCSLFPKSFSFTKSTLIYLWISMGYVESEYIDQRLEEVAEGYMLCLVNRGFFRCIVRNGYTDEFMMPNLMHDLVLSIAGLKYKITTSDTNEFDESVCHVSFYLPEFTPWQAPPSLFKIKQLKSFLLPVPPVRHIRDFCQPVSVFRSNKMFISSFQSLRTLRMCGLKIDRLPNSLGKLIHLRYLDFSWNSICKLPDSVTQLANLYFLDLSNCEKLEELPEDISKLVMLRHLYLSRCFKLSHMPLELRRLVGLETLDYFVVGHKPRNTTPYGSNKAKPACSLADLGCLDNLKGVLTMVLADRSEDIVSEAKAANMDSKEITEFNMIFEGNRINDEMVLENLTPGADLEFLRIEKYGGKSLPSWMRERIHFQLPNLVSVEIVECKECIYMCSFGSLPNLQALILRKLEKVEYVELVPDEHSTCTSTTPLLLFPSLRHLHLTDMPRLKGWWGVTKASQDASLNHDQLLKQIPAFRKLESVKMNMELVISLLPQLFPQGNSSLQKLNVLGQTYGPSHVPAKRRQPVVVVPLQNYLPTLPELYLDDSEMEVVPEEFRGMTCLKRLYICNCEDLEEVPKWIDSFTSLEMLFIDNCPKLKSLPDEISNLSNLKSLVLNGCLWNLQKKMPQMASRLGGN